MIRERTRLLTRSPHKRACNPSRGHLPPLTQSKYCSSSMLVNNASVFRGLAIWKLKGCGIFRGPARPRTRPSRPERALSSPQNWLKSKFSLRPKFARTGARLRRLKLPLGRFFHAATPARSLRAFWTRLVFASTIGRSSPSKFYSPPAARGRQSEDPRLPERFEIHEKLQRNRRQRNSGAAVVFNGAFDTCPLCRMATSQVARSVC